MYTYTFINIPIYKYVYTSNAEYVYLYTLVHTGVLAHSSITDISTARRLALDSWSLKGNAQWSARRGFGAVVVNSTIIVMGGRGKCMKY